VGDESVCANVVATDPEEPMDPRRESIRILDEESGRAAKEPEVCRGLRGISVVTEGVESERVAWEGTEPEVCRGLRGISVLTEGVESERVACEGTDPEVRRGLRVESRLSLNC
jgi:hypothetical protein